jgi:hypothetical protein
MVRSSQSENDLLMDEPVLSLSVFTGKIGLLPKRPVSLLSSDRPSAHKPRDDDDTDELEYVENPFEQKG